MALVTADAIVLQTFPYGETSKIARVLTRTHGVQSAIAKGALRPKSRFGGILEPFSEGVASLYIKSSRELQTMSAFELHRSGQALGRDLLRFGGASLIAEMVIRTASEEPQPGLFDAVSAAFASIAGASPQTLEAQVLAQAWRTIGLLGFEPALAECGYCNRVLAADEDTTIDYAAGGLRCSACGAHTHGNKLPAHARRDLIELQAGGTPALARTEGHWKVLARYLDHHVLEGGRLRSLAFLAATIEGGPWTD